MNLEKIVKQEIEELEQREDVKAVFIVGSYARDPEKEHNDVDLFIIVDGDWRKRETKETEGIVVERFFNSEEWVSKYVEERDWWKNYHWFTNANPVYDPENLIEKYREKVEIRKKEYLNTKPDEAEARHYIWDYKQDIKTEDVGQKRYMMYKLFDYLIDLHYQFKEEIPVKSNYKVKKLKNFDGYMYKLAQDFLNSSSTMKKEQKLDKMIKHVTRGIGKPQPEWETEKEKLND